MTDKDLMNFRDEMKEIKGLGAMPTNCSSMELLGAVNTLLIEAYEFSKSRNIEGIVAGMNIFMERLNLKKEWMPVIPEGLDHPLFEMREEY